ncbi:O(6)-methylguanine-induced apoptosis 2 [Austrofundulus limnaeus]|uniref:O(6)-methylguanine-induced apoptosis 2 n=1 Tax=Austrofundulus limnaeus TaxID=52670 RepID=A0A2I4D424_AUSLI|nr:PREDICTED: O(6)-methylguanine-induced apoptosis 2-like [Austrofundulus limnaeus]
MDRSSNIKEPEKKGSSSQARRFPPTPTENPGPGPACYDCVSSCELFSPSFSKKGTCGFIKSKPVRTQQDFPGPASYNLQRSFINQQDFSVGVSRVFRSPVAVQWDTPKHRTPAPNQYQNQVSSDRSRTSSANGSAVFLSKTTRDSVWVNKDVPPPGHYEVSSSLLHSGPTGFSSPFRSRTQRLPGAENQVPGPGTYSPHQSAPLVKRTPLLRRSCCLVIAQPAQVVQKDPPVPGPGTYNVGGSDPSSKHLRSTAVFASGTERIPQNLQDETTPGPGSYNPVLLSKQSFLYGPTDWIPI